MSGATPSGSESDDTIPVGSASTPRPAQRSGGLARGTAVSRYVVLSPIGTGAMGTVYAAIDPDLERKVALKILEHGSDRLAREAQTLAQLSHPNVVAVYDVGVSEGRPFVAMELVEGESLHAWLRGEHALEKVLDTFILAGRGLAAAHARGIIHRDFKPANVLVARDGAVKVADFGLAGLSKSAASGDSGALISSGDLELTKTGALMGTPLFMAPELHKGRRGTEYGDQYAYCVALHLAIYGVHPFEHDDITTLVTATGRGRVVDAPAGSNVPRRLRELVLRGLRVDPEQRHPSMQALLEQLDRMRRPRWPFWVAGTGLAVGGLGLAASVAGRTSADPCATVATALSTTWNDEVRARVNEALSATQLSYAATTREGVVQELDAYAERWTEARASACATASREPGAATAEQAVACLDRSRSTLQAVLDLLVKADAQTLSAAVELTDAVPDPDSCFDPTTAYATPTPGDRELGVSVLQLRQRLDRLGLDRVSGHTTSTDALEAFVAEAEALGFLPLVAEAKIERARTAERLHLFPQAEVDTRAALELAIAIDYDRVAALAIASLLRLEIEYGRRHELLPTLLMLADGYLARWPDNGDITVLLLTSATYALAAAGHFEPAHVNAERLRQMALAGNELWLYHQALSVLGQVYAHEGRYAEALAVHALEASVTEVRLGTAHPSLAYSWHSIALAYLSYGMPEAALEALARHRKLREGAPEIVFDARAHATTANAHYRLGDYEAAFASAQEGFAVLERIGEQDNAWSAALCTVAGDAADALGRKREALKWYERSIEIRRRADSAPALLVTPMANAGSTYWTLGEYDEAIRRLDEAMAISIAVSGDDHPDVGRIRFMIGLVLVDSGDNARAQRELSSAVASMAASQDADSSDLAEARVWLARAEANLGNVEEAARLVQLGLTVDGLASDSHCHGELVWARILDARGEREAALKAGMRAKQAAGTQANATECAAEVDAWLGTR